MIHKMEDLEMGVVSCDEDDDRSSSLKPRLPRSRIVARISRRIQQTFSSFVS